MTAVDRQVVLRRFTRATYQVAAVGALALTVQAVIFPAVGAGPVWLLATIPPLLTAAAVLTIKSIPYEHVKFPG
ncbi:hypothetical protein [Actinoplanes solisilvae]|uniref:hypothetical protein n=1 Tax=Actinoplanes solisilvae TaxID=2486853 RepID=UPI000FD8D46F|nr:hypothetical protein [Actinoplanes solisilvae]